MITLMLPDQEVPDSIPGSTVGFFFNGKLFHYMYGIGVSVSMSMFYPVLSSEESSHSLITDQERSSKSVRSPTCGQ